MESNPSYIPFNLDPPEREVVVGCGNHSTFFEGKCVACGRPAEAIVHASNKMLAPKGDPGRAKGGDADDPEGVEALKGN